ncbi:TAP-like protein-domain-containing protein [Cladorrhinum samala]|uniref:TAP-like protein-domain-containing protein n=1 Tax=Cladorrhinum samala TaxID=585594 RepID=A0AAV9HIN9_9PEZI|nr:TAP-like protein-domain-containing protein [Cladorrhinum samala]
MFFVLQHQAKKKIKKMGIPEIDANPHPLTGQSLARNSRRRHGTCLSLIAIIVGILFLGSLPNIRFFNPSLWGHDDASSSSSSSSPSSASSSSSKPDPNNPWKSITPSRRLEWHPCYQSFPPHTFLCARLSLPMNYNESPSESTSWQSSSGDSVSIALLLLPASSHSNSTSSGSGFGPEQKKPGTFRPPLMVNPGGPGGSGVQFALLFGSAVQKVFGESQPVLGFDPRGVGYSTPLADCWARKPAACRMGPGQDCEEDAAGGLRRRIEWENGMMGAGAYGLLNDSETNLGLLNSGQRGVNELCRGKEKSLEEERRGGGGILKYAGTKYVARDMVGILDAWDEWVEEEGKKGGNKEDVKEKKENKEGKKEKAKLTYWGFSYGTYLGMTFARMFPDRVGRMVLDGVVDAGYYESEFWSESLLDADKAWDKFFEYCLKAKGKCAFWREGDERAETLRRRYEETLEALESRESGPVTFTHPEYFYPVVLRRSFVRLLVFGSLKSPVLAYPAVAEILNVLHRRSYENLSAMFGDLQALCLMPGGLPFSIRNDAQRAIMCGDKKEKHQMNLTIPEIREAYGKMAKVSQFADIWVGLMLQCNGWDISEPYRLDSDLLKKQWLDSSSGGGGSSSDHYHHHQTQINTSFPILFMGNTHDPVTPLKAAVKMSLRFRDAGLLELKTEGHCTLGSSASVCIARAVRDYVLHGKVPPPARVKGKNYLDGKWTTCDADETPWNRVGSFEAAYQRGGDGDVALMEAMNEMRDAIGKVNQLDNFQVGTKESRALMESFVSKSLGSV